MPDIISPEKTVFISYRREPSKYAAALMFHYLRDQGFDVFYDIASIDSGAFDETILSQIAARMHFVVILAPGTLDRCVNADGSDNAEDWLRREIEHAMNMQRNIIPVLMDNFNYKETAPFLTGKLAQLPRYQSHDIPYTYLEEGLERLIKRYLKPPPNPVVIQPLTPEQVNAAEAKISEAVALPAPTKEELSAEEYFNRAVIHHSGGDLEQAIADYDEAIRLNADYLEAYLNRSTARREVGDKQGAIADYGQAMRLKMPDEWVIHRQLAKHHYDNGDFEQALKEYDVVLKHNPDDPASYYNRGLAYRGQDKFDDAIEDYTKAIELDPTYFRAYFNRAYARSHKGDLVGAIADYTESIQIEPEDAVAYGNRGEIYFALQDFLAAEADFKTAKGLEPEALIVLAGLAITQHRMGKLNQSYRLWKRLLEIDQRYRDPEWARQEFNWADPLVKEAKKLIGRL